MERKNTFWDRFTEDMDLYSETSPGQPVVEISGTSRILIENHHGVAEYSCNKIGIRVKYGLICISGSCLELIKMTKEQLIISGKIECVLLIQRRQP